MFEGVLSEGVQQVLYEGVQHWTILEGVLSEKIQHWTVFDGVQTVMVVTDGIQQ